MLALVVALIPTVIKVKGKIYSLDWNFDRFKPWADYFLVLILIFIFQEYKMHLVSDLHKSQFHRLARKHSVVLRKIRLQQRREQTEIEAKWKEEKAEGFEKAISW